MNTELREHAATTASAQNEQYRQHCIPPTLELRSIGTQESSLLLASFFTWLSSMGLALLPDAASQAATIKMLNAGLFPVRASSSSKSKAC